MALLRFPEQARPRLKFAQIFPALVHAYSGRGPALTLLGLALAGIIFPCSRLCAGTILSDAGYAITVWQTEDGLSQNSVTTISQSEDGYIWIGTYDGLSRFDGVRFQNYNAVNTPELQDSRIVSLHVDRQDRLWIGHDSGRLTSFQKGGFIDWKLKNVSTDQKIVALTTDRAGQLWWLARNGTLENAQTHQVLAARGITEDPNTLFLAQDKAGRTSLAIEGVLYEVESDALARINLGPARRTGFVAGICPASPSGLWIVRDGQVRLFRNGAFLSETRPAPWGNAAVTAMIELKDGSVAVGTMDQGLYILPPEGAFAHIDHTNGLPQDWIRCLFEDREGNLWVGDGSGGLAMLHRTALSLLNAPDQWQGRTVLSVAPSRDGALWIGTEGAGLYRHDAGGWKRYGEKEGLNNLFVWSITESGADGPWVGTWGGGVYEMRDQRLIQRLDLNPSLAPAFALTYTEADNTLWIGSAAGLFVGQAPTTSHRPLSPLASIPSVTCMAPMADGTLWVGLSHEGIGRLDHGRWTQYTRKNGLSSDSVQCLLTETDGTLWIGTADGGLNRFRGGRFASIGMDEGLSSNAICHIADDGLGHLWLSTHRGLLRIRKMDLNRCADGLVAEVKVKTFGREDGLPTLEFSGGLQAAGCRTLDGRLWFTSNKGLVAVDPRRVPRNDSPPPLVIETARCDGQDLPLSGTLELKPENQRLEVDYTALSFTAPGKVRFKYRLEGLEKDWTDAGARRTATYSHLPAGSYRLDVVAANDDGVWNTTPVSLPFVVLPFFWQQPWFVMATAGLLLGGIVVAARFEARRRVGKKLEELHRRHAIEAERIRIARDIHDDIGSSVTRISMLSQTASNADSPEQKQRVLDSICGSARELTRALDEIVWAVDPQHDTLESFGRYIGNFAQEFLAAAGVRCRLDLPDTLPGGTFPTQVRHQLFLAFKEGLNNAVKHGAPTEVRVSLRTAPDGFRLCIEDNGRGFGSGMPGVLAADGDAEVEEGNGLSNMKARLASINGSCVIASLPGQGTRLCFTLGLGPTSEAAAQEELPPVRTADHQDKAQ